MTINVQITVDPSTLASLQAIVDSVTGKKYEALLSALTDQLKSSETKLSQTIAQ